MTEKFKFFIIEVTYRIPADQFGDVLFEHRAFLQTGYDRGWLLLSGPQVPRTGGVIVGRAPSLEAMEDFFVLDPYRVKDLADYRFIEFDPVMRAQLMDAWVKGE